MSRAPIGWGIAGEIETALETPGHAGARQVAASRCRSAQIAYWLGTRRNVPSVAEIINAWHVSRPTAYRWRKFAESGGQEFPDTNRSKAR